MADNKNNFEYPLPIGTVLKGGHLDYRVEQVLGQGGFGLTYKVSAKITVGHIKSSMMFAVKEHFVKGRCHRAADGITVEYSDEMSAEIENSMRSFVTEGRRLNNICKLNRNIVDVNEVFEANNTAYYVMEYLDGGDLRSLIRKNGGRLGETKALSIIRPIAEAVRQLHKERLLHLDIKPENIVMRKGESAGMDEPVLIDFGITKHFDTYGNITTTSLSTAYSEGYSPQEQYGRIVSFSPWVDVYSLAATLYYMLVGKDPVSAFDLRPEYLDESLPADISELTRNAITAGMAKDYMLRTQTVQAFIDSLEESTILSAGSILHGQDSMYRIQGLDEERGFCMVYKATVYSGGEQRGGNMTKTDVFTVYEYFVKGNNVKRLPNGHISGIRSEEEYYMIEAASKLYTRPEVPFEATRWEINGKTVLEIYVAPCPDRPYMAPDKDDRFKAYIRVADENILANKVLVLAWQKRHQTDGTLLKISQPVERLLAYLDNHAYITLRQFCRIGKIKHYTATHIISDLLAMQTIRYVVIDKQIAYQRAPLQ